MCKRLMFGFVLVGMLMVVTQAAEPLGYWPFDGNLNDAVGSANGTFLGGQPEYVTGKVSQALMFDGVDDLVQVMVENLDAYTISAWVMPARTDAASIIARTDASGPTTSWSHQMRVAASGVFEHYLWDGSAHNVLGTTPVETNRWYFVTITATNGGSMHLYINGQEEGDSTILGTLWGSGDRFAFGSNSGNSMGWFQGIIDDVQIHNEALAVEEIATLMRSGLAASAKPSPADGATDVLRDIVLSWSPGHFAQTHDVYFGTLFEDVNDAGRANPMGVLVHQGQTETTYDPGRLDFGQTYYWRVDEVNAAPDQTIFKGNIWSFTVEPFAYTIQNILATSNMTSIPGQGPERLVDGSGLNDMDQHSNEVEDMWNGVPNPNEPSYLQFEFDRLYKLHEMLIWNYNMQFELWLGLGVKEATIEYSIDGIVWTSMGDIELGQAPGEPTYTYDTIVDFDGAAVRFVRMTVISSFGATASSHGLSEVRFTYIPVHAGEPNPADGAVNVSANTALSWRPGREAAVHEIYLSTDPNVLALAGTATETTFTPAGGFDLDVTTYWQIVEVNDVEPITEWAGDIWSFTTEEYIVIDDFDDYVDEPEDGDVIWEIWIDGLVEFGGDADNGGGVVGYAFSPFAEQSLVRSGQSLPLFFDNPSASAISEADRALIPAQDWTTNGIKTLTLWFQGAEGNAGSLYVKINDTKVVYDGDIATPLWQQWIIDLSTVGANLSHVTTLSIGVQGAGSGVIFVDDIRLYGKLPEYITPVEPDAESLLLHYTFEGNVLDSSGHGIDGEAIGDPIYGTGVDGQAMQFDGIDDYVSVVVDVPENGYAAAFWFKSTNPSCGMYAVVQNRLGDGGYDRMIYLTDGAVGARIWENEAITAAIKVADGQWHHVVHTFGEAIGGQRLYIDGSLQAQGAKAVSDFDTQERVHFGWSYDAYDVYFEGMMDDARIYNRTLSPAEIAWLAGKTTSVLMPFEDSDL